MCIIKVVMKMDEKMPYEQLWTCDLNTVKKEKLQEAFLFYFKEKCPKTKKELIEKINLEKQKREKRYTLVLEIDAEEKIRMPFTFFAWEENGNIHNSAYLAEIDAFTVHFSDEKHLKKHILENAEKYFSLEHSSFLNSCKDELTLSDLNLRIIEDMELPKTGKYYNFYEVVYSDNNYLKEFFRLKSFRTKNDPFYSLNYFSMNESIQGVFDYCIDKVPGFKEFSQDELHGNVWSFNKTLSSDDLRNLFNENESSEGKAFIELTKVFKKYKNIRVASIILSNFEKQNMKRSNL